MSYGQAQGVTVTVKEFYSTLKGFILATFCFDLDSVGGKEVARLLRSGFGFSATQVRTDDFLKDGGRFYAEEHIEKMERSGVVFMLDISRRFA